MLSGSIVISLAIATAITVSPASGFTIRRSENILDSTPDLEAGESTQLKVKYDIKALTSNKTLDVSNFKGDSDPTVIAINDPKNLDKKSAINRNIIAFTATVNEIPKQTTPKQTSTDIKHEVTSATTTSVSTETSIIYTTSATSTSQTTTREPDKSEDLSTNSTPQTTVVFQPEITTFKEHFNNATEKVIIETEIKANETKTTEIQHVSETKAVTANRNVNEQITTTKKYEEQNYTNNFNDSDANKNNNSSRTTSTESNTFDKDITQSNITLKNETNDNVLKADQSTTTKEEIVDTTTYGPLDASSTVASEPETDATNITLEAFTTETTTQYNKTETTTIDLITSTLRSWKKYTTIDRKRTTIEDTTVPSKDMVRAETAQTRIALEKVLSNTPIPSLAKLKNDFINAEVSTTRKTETSSKGVERNVTSIPEITTKSAQKMSATVESKTTKLEIVSKRAGYRDNIETTSLKTEQATTSNFPQQMTTNNTEMFSSMYETEPSELEVPNNKNRTAYGSQSQLAEDAIKEELLKEETLNDNEENAQRHHDERNSATENKALKPGNINEPVTQHETVTEDMLSVKPISVDTKKNTILYAVSPNYKPLKKIDVRPPKQFVRDPDDNSWRNESISSLGIVFKPGNASKSFTQVLKNKTEVELANMMDRDNKGDIPDLKVRLEKIAEVRKSKKKNKFGDTVYSDYEESVYNTKEDATSPMSPLVESVLPYTPPPLSESSTPEFDLTVNAITKEKLDFFKKDLTTPLTTTKPKKYYNIAEYYDANDEYDADYVNLHKIDLKKFTQPVKLKEPSPTQRPDMLYTKTMKEYQPERKATVQYFPPTKKITQKVNLNDYDAGFNRKVNLYTFKEPPKTVLPASFGTISPIQTEKYEPVNKQTVKPVFTPIYKSDDWDKNLYLTNQPRVSEAPSGFVPNDGNFNRASYVIKHYKDFINEAAKESEDDRNVEYPYTETPLRGVTLNELSRMTTSRDDNPEEYDYDVKFRKDILNRFVDNFNQNSERFKVDFPILYNSSVVHRQAPENGKAASSSAFLKRLYEAGNPRTPSFLSPRKPCDPHCDMTLELSPAYELHYYVPEQEEKEEMEPRPITVPNRFRL